MNPSHAVRMTLAEHLDELRTRLIRSIVYLLVAVVVAMIFYKDLVRIVTIPHFQAMEWCGLGRDHARLIACSYSGPVLTVVKLAMIVGLIAASPLIAREIWGFVAAGLQRSERKYVVRFAPISFLLFMLGCVFGFFVLVPYSLFGMARMMPADQVQPLFNFGDYLNLVLTLTICLGGIFQVPLVMTFLSTVGLVRPATYARGRRAAIVANVVVAAVISPPDLISMAAFAIPLLLLYEVGILSARIAVRARGAALFGRNR